MPDLINKLISSLARRYELTPREVPPSEAQNSEPVASSPEVDSLPPVPNQVQEFFKTAVRCLSAATVKTGIVLAPLFRVLSLIVNRFRGPFTRVIAWLIRDTSAVDSKPASREWLLHSMVIVMAIALGVRLLCLQVFSRQIFAAKALRQQISEEPIPSRPGDLLDRQGRLLATTIAVPSLYVNPKAVKDRAQLAIDLGLALKIDPAQLQQRLDDNAGKQFLWIKRRLSDDEAAAIRELKLPSRIAGLRREFQRVYPQGHLAAHVIGLRNIDGVGRGGVEEFFDKQLRGTDGMRRFVRDARGYVLDVLEEVTQPPVDGTSLVLTIDMLMQLHVERQLDALMKKHDAHGACAIVLDPQSGEILALASRPTFDPNHPEQATPDDWKNMATSSVFEPGSTFKPMVVAWALDQGVITRDEMLHCEMGAYRMGRRILHDHHRYGTMSLADVLVKSSNIGMAKIGEKLGNEQLSLMANAFGFGRRTGVELPGELTGLLRPLEDWTSYSTGSIPMGQELAATPLQVLAAHAILANGGQRISPHLLLRTNGDRPIPRQVIVSRVVSADSANWLVTGPMVEVVQRGTGKLAKIPDVTVFGKTGTAQKAHNDERGYSSSRNLSSFVGGASAENPRLLVLVSVDEPQGADQFGGSVAAPYVAAILKTGLAVVGNKPQTAPVTLSAKPEAVE
ncbi:peptidoglycan D,D-transpeptidase FtsI family protein [Planctomicrobium piriforme]|uniref:Cell division protein FtsI (Penicillin-binding protein 3) n=1 Tax=Planctomicrobium piriforme TaxID=1576369 RepID=A0A1I3P730_9PLAN|nr:penicillin-binding protein 2 [Planctomicrobium piriforme]SFJ17343.1 cell division protein FtsI (penicillin-binding protein 3) [Planctomicrobium piriforme]